MSVREVQIAEHVDKITELLQANWAETGFDFDFCPNFESYIEGQRQGLIIALAAFDGDEIIGYSTAVLHHHLFNPELIFCTNDALFLLPEYRKSINSARLILETERVAKERGAHQMMWHGRTGTPLAEILFNHGYQIDSIAMRRRLQ